MKYLQLVWAALMRHKARTLFTLLSVGAAFLLFGLLDSVRGAFAGASNNVAGLNRLVTVSKISFTVQLPKSLLERIQAVPGVADVTYANWFGGIYQEQKNFFPNQAVAGNYLDLFPEWRPHPQRARGVSQHPHRCGGGCVAGAEISLARGGQDSTAGDHLSAEKWQQHLGPGPGGHLSGFRSAATLAGKRPAVQLGLLR